MNIMGSLQREAVIIGETNLCNECAKLLLKKGWKILTIVSSDPVVINWCERNHIRNISFANLGTINAKGFYLFSIINSHIIPKSFFL